MNNKFEKKYKMKVLKLTLILVPLFLITRTLIQSEQKTAKLANSIRSADRWQKILDRSLEDRIIEAPLDLLKYIAKDNAENEIQSSPRSVNISSETKSFVRQIIVGLPKSQLMAIQKKLVAITFVSGLGSAGYTESIEDDAGHFIGGLIVLDSSTTTKNAGQWVSERDESAFENGPFQVQFSLTNRSLPTISALEYTLRHEVAHLITLNGDLVPHWNINQIQKLDFLSFKFLGISWKEDLTPIAGRFPSDKEPLNFFTDKRIANSMILKAYSWLHLTDFSSLYASQNFAEDFAESTTLFYYTKILGYKYQVKVLKNGQSYKNIDNCWSRNNCQKKFKILSRLF